MDPAAASHPVVKDINHHQGKGVAWQQQGSLWVNITHDLSNTSGASNAAWLNSGNGQSQSLCPGLCSSSSSAVLGNKGSSGLDYSVIISSFPECGNPPVDQHLAVTGDTSAKPRSDGYYPHVRPPDGYADN